MCHSLSSTLLFAVPSVLPHPHSTGFRPFCLEEKQSVIAEVYRGVLPRFGTVWVVLLSPSCTSETSGEPETALAAGPVPPRAAGGPRMSLILWTGRPRLRVQVHTPRSWQRLHVNPGSPFRSVSPSFESPHSVRSSFRPSCSSTDLAGNSQVAG